MVLVLQNLFILMCGFSLLILAGDKLVETSVRIARRWKVPASVVAVTIIAAGTSAPELFTSFLAGFKGNSDIAVGNVIGSNTFNILAVGGLSLFLQPAASLKGTFHSWVFLIAGTMVFFFAMSDLELSRWEALLLIGGLLCFIIFSFFQEREKESSFENLSEPKISRTLFFFSLSLIGLIMGAELALTGGVALGKMGGLSERVIAITIISVGTGLPELATSVAAAFRGHGDIAIANVIGSNFFNTVAIPGITASFFALKVDHQFLNLDFIVMAIATLSIFSIYIIKNSKARQALGVLMFLSYSAYAVFLITN